MPLFLIFTLVQFADAFGGGSPARQVVNTRASTSRSVVSHQGPMSTSPGLPGGSSCAIQDAGCSTNSFVKIDVRSKCICLGTSCHRVDIGFGGPNMTYNGTGTIQDCNGAKYQTKSYDNTTSFDKDCVAMGIHENDKDGKWIHKARDCQGGGNSTAGCVAVPCAIWAHVKAARGQRVTICGGKGGGQSYAPPTYRASGRLDGVVGASLRHNVRYQRTGRPASSQPGRARGVY